MPTYEYACVDCGTHVEVYQRFSDEPLTACGLCGGRLRKVFHPAGILFKGSGFYRTDNRKGSDGSGSGGSAGDGKGATAAKPEGGKGSSSSSTSEASGSSSSSSGSGSSGSSSGSGSGASKGKSA